MKAIRVPLSPDAFFNEIGHLRHLQPVDQHCCRSPSDDARLLMTRDRMAAEDFLLTHQTQVSKLEFDRLVGATSLAPRTKKKQRLLSEVG